MPRGQGVGQGPGVICSLVEQATSTRMPRKRLSSIKRLARYGRMFTGAQNFPGGFWFNLVPSGQQSLICDGLWF